MLSPETKRKMDEERRERRERRARGERVGGDPEDDLSTEEDEEAERTIEVRL